MSEASTSTTYLGRVVRSERKRRGWTQEELAERIGLALPNISRLETGAHRDTHWSTAIALADTLGLSLEALRDPATRPAGLLVPAEGLAVWAALLGEVER